MPGLTAAQRAAVQEYEAAIGELRWLNAEVLAAAGQLRPVTIEALLARSDLEVGLEGPAPRLARNGLNQQRNGPVVSSSGTAVPEPPHCPFPDYLVCPRTTSA